MKKLSGKLWGLIIPVAVVIVWYLMTNYGAIPKSILPRISSVGKAFTNLVKTGQLRTDLSTSIIRVLRGYAVSVAVGGVIGILTGMFKRARAIFTLTVTCIRQIPIIAWIPLIMLWCGIGDVSKTVIIVIAAVFPLLLNTESGIADTPEGYIEVARLYKLNKWQTFVKVYLPHALPQIFVGLKLALGASWMAVVTAELIAATIGIGYRMNEARSLMRSDVVIVCMAIIGVVGILMDKALGAAFRALTPWENERKVRVAGGRKDCRN